VEKEAPPRAFGNEKIQILHFL